MAIKSSGTGANKITFGQRRTGKAKKSHNKHDRTPKVYRGQGR